MSLHNLPPYASIRPEERLCRVTESMYTALNIAYDQLEETILLRSLDQHSESEREPTAVEAHDLARFEQLFRSIYFDKDQVRSQLKSPLHRSIDNAIRSLLGDLPEYGAIDT